MAFHKLKRQYSHGKVIVVYCVDNDWARLRPDPTAHLVGETKGRALTTSEGYLTARQTWAVA